MNQTVFSLLFLLMAVTGMASCGNASSEKIRINTFSGYSRNFNDLPSRHLAAAKKIGIDPVMNRKEALKNKKLVRIRSNRYYVLEDLTHSVPFLVKEADVLLRAIGKNFRDSLASKHAPAYKIIVTSVTRTEEDVTRLRKQNVNASESSTHLYGTTFDIAYGRFEKTGRSKTELTLDQLKSVLAEVLQALQKQGKCYVKYEIRQHCFHITAR